MLHCLIPWLNLLPRLWCITRNFFCGRNGQRWYIETVGFVEVWLGEDDVCLYRTSTFILNVGGKVGMILFICAPSPPKDAGEGYNGIDHTVRRWFGKGDSFNKYIWPFLVHPGKLTWNLRIHRWKRKSYSKPSFSASIPIFLNLWGCIYIYI